MTRPTKSAIIAAKAEREYQELERFRLAQAAAFRAESDRLAQSRLDAFAPAMQAEIVRKIANLREAFRLAGPINHAPFPATPRVAGARRALVPLQASLFGN